MSVLEWKKFNFFNLIPCTDYNKLRNIKSEITAQCANASQKVFCDALGFVHVFFRNWDCVSFQAHSSTIRLCALSNESNFLITLAQDIPKNSVFIQIFNLQKLTKRNGAPCVATARLTSLNLATVLKVCLINTQICVVIGFERGDVLMYRGLVSRDISSHFRPLAIGTRAINGIEFKQKGASTFCMYICSDGGVFCYTITENNAVNETKITLDSDVGPARCCAINASGRGDADFIVGKDDAVYCFTNDGRGPCYVIDGEKKCLAWFGNYLVLVVQPNRARLPSNALLELIVIDIQNKLIILSKEVEAITNILVENSNCYFLTKTNEIFTLEEKTLQSKLRLVLSKNLYDVALRLVEDNDSDEKLAGDINLHYGDYLLSKGDVSGAVQRYSKTVGIIEPYCVIRKLLDSRYNKYLAQYLTEVVKSNHATKDHLELLLNCKERVDLPVKIQQICLDEEPEYNLYCSSSEQLVFGSASNKRTKISITNFTALINDCEKVSQLFLALDEDSIYGFFIENAQKLMNNHPKETTDVLKSLTCSGKFSKDPPIYQPERFIPIFMTHSKYCIAFLEHVVEHSPFANKAVYNYLCELYLSEWEAGRKEASEVLDYLEAKSEFLSTEEVLILSSNHSFWPGIVKVYKKSDQFHLYAPYIFKNNDLKDLIAQTSKYGDISPSRWLQIVNKSDLKSEDLAKFFYHLLNAMLLDKSQSLLHILRSIATNKNVQVRHFKEFFSMESMEKTSGSQLNETVQNLSQELDSLKDLLSKFSANPIEFRSSFCDICRQQLKLPVVYYLCHHSFHKECITAYSESKVCVVCKSKRDELLSATDRSFEGIQLSDRANGHDTTEVISSFIAGGLFESLDKNAEYLLKNFIKTENTSVPPVINTESPGRKGWAGRFSTSGPSVVRSTNPYDESKNPFENEESTNPFLEYDDNLNPFNE